MGIMKVVSNVTDINEWKYSYFKGDDSRDLNTENLAETVLDNKEQYVLKYAETPQTEELQRIKQLAGV